MSRSIIGYLAALLAVAPCLPLAAQSGVACPPAPDTAIVVFDEASGRPVRAIGGPETCLGVPEKVAVAANGELYVLNDASLVDVFPPGASGNVRPWGQIPLGPSRGGFTGLELDRDRNVYVSGASIQVFSAGADSRSAPSRTIAGPRTHLGYPGDLAFDSWGDMYVSLPSSRYDRRGEVVVYHHDARGDVQPVRVIRRPGENGVFNPKRLAVGPGDTLFVLSTFSPWCFVERQLGTVEVYPPQASGQVEPVRSVAIAWEDRFEQDSIDTPNGIAVDERGFLYVSVDGPNAVLVYAPGASGRARPVRTMRWPGYVPPEYSSDWSWWRSLARDGRGKLYVTQKRINGPAGCA